MLQIPPMSATTIAELVVARGGDDHVGLRFETQS
jgi:hypothetical protein